MKKINLLKEYKENKGFSYSSLSNLALSPSFYLFRKEKQAEGDALTLGSCIDTLLTSPDDFDNNFIINKYPKPSAQAGEFCDAILSINPGLTEEEIYTLAYDKLKEAKEKSGVSLKNKIEKFIENHNTKGGKEYIQFVIESSTSNKSVIGLEEYKQAEKICNILKTNDYTSKYFVNDDENISILYQYPIYFTLEGIEFKTLPDIVYVDHYDKTIRILDLKTTSKSIYKFIDSFFLYKYYLQYTMFYDAAEELKNSLDLKKYKVLDPLYIVQETEMYASPFMYNMSSYLKLGRIGAYYKDEYKKGYLTLGKELKWHKENNLWEYPVDVYNQEGVRIVYGDIGNAEDSK